jgi:hypothetical protein
MADSGDQDHPQPSQATVILRWVAFAPAALLACVVGRFLIVLINRFGMSRYVEPDTFMWRVVDQYASGLALGAIFVYVSSCVAPSHKKAVAIASAGFVLVLAGFLLFPSVLDGEYWAIFEILCMGFGACLVAYSIFADELRFDS